MNVSVWTKTLFPKSKCLKYTSNRHEKCANLYQKCKLNNFHPNVTSIYGQHVPHWTENVTEILLFRLGPPLTSETRVSPCILMKIYCGRKNGAILWIPSIKAIHKEEATIFCFKVTIIILF